MLVKKTLLIITNLAGFTSCTSVLFNFSAFCW